MKVVLGSENRMKFLLFNRTVRSYFISVGNYSVIKEKKAIVANEPKESIEKKMKEIRTDSVHRLEDVKRNLTAQYRVTFEPTPVKSANDLKEYLVMRLPNNLTALLISDVQNLVNPTDHKSDANTFNEIMEYTVKRDAPGSLAAKEKLAACSLTVAAGSFDDPDHIPGLAHLLEHMVFMGSEKYPDENEFNSFLVSRGGSNNASTDTETTTYFFDCPETCLAETLDRFSSFFIKPLLKQDTMVRERMAIESEFQMHSKNDALRTHQIIANTASVRNPSRKFMWGNLKTLRDDLNDRDLYRWLWKFWQDNYSADRMTVAVQARLPLTTLGRWTAEYFGKIPTNNVPDRMYPYIDPPFNHDLFHKMYTVMPVADVNVLRLTWALPPVLHLYRSKPTLYQSFMLGYEGKGSLMSYLKKKLWALSVSAGNGCDGTENNSTFSLFTIGVLLTENGVTNIEKVLSSVFSYLKMLRKRKPCRSICKEIKFLADTNFRFTPEIGSSDYTQYASQCMHLYPPEDYLTGSRLFFEFKPEQTTNFLDLLLPEKVNVVLLSKKAAAQVVLDRTEKWFQAEYHTNAIPEKWIKDWKTCKLDLNFYLPPLNEFIPTDFTLLPADAERRPDIPTKLVYNSHMELWYKPDQIFRLPFGYINVYFISPLSMSLPETSVLCELFTLLFSTVYDEVLYPATVAGLNHTLSVADYGMCLSICGYNEKLQKYLTIVLDSIVSLKKKISIGLFEAVKEAQRKIYYNDLLNPSMLAKELRLTILCEPFCNTLTKLEVITKLKLEKLLEFCDRFFINLYVKCLIQGNLTQEQAIDISWKIRKQLNYDPFLAGGSPRIRVRQIPIGNNELRVKALNAEDKNCCVVNYYQCGLNNHVEDTCLIEMLMMHIAEPFFDTLRTKEQLGYFVSNDSKYTYGVVGFTLAVKFQSDKFSAQHVENRISEFLEKTKTQILRMSVEEFNRLKDSIKMLKLQADTQLADEVERNWSEIENDEYVFDRLKRECCFLDTLSKHDLFKYFLDVLDNSADDSGVNSRRMRKLSIQVDAGDSSLVISDDNKKAAVAPFENKHPKNTHVLQIIQPQDKTNSNNLNSINSIDDFKASMYIYPLSKFKL